MVDYLYQLDYTIKPELCNGIFAVEEPDTYTDPNHQHHHLPPTEPASPVAQVIDRFEDLASAHQIEIADYPFPAATRSKKAKKKKRTTSSWSYMSPPHMDYDESVVQIVDSVPSPGWKEMELNTHAQMYALADRYGILDLKDLAREKFAEVVKREWEGSGFVVAVRTVYSTTEEGDEGLRGLVVDTLSRHRELLEKGDVRALVKETNGLAFGLLKSAWGI